MRIRRTLNLLWLTVGAAWVLTAGWEPGTLASAQETSAQEASAPKIEPAHFHHVRINTTDPQQSMEFYRRVVGAVKLPYRGGPEVLLVDRAFLIFNQVATPPPWELTSGLYHIGWGCKDAEAEQAWLKKHGAEIETPATRLGPFQYLYAYGPSRELFEFYSGIPHPRFSHVHLISEDVPATTRWYMEHLGLRGPSRMPPRPPQPPADFRADPENPIAAMRYLQATELQTADEVRINIFARPGHGNYNWWRHSDNPPAELQPSQGRALDRIAFAVTDLTAIRDRMRRNGVSFVHDIALDDRYQFKSFLVIGPDEVLIEVVEEKPIPEGIWAD